jgi:uncharacterized membrane protein YhhN
MNKSPWLILFLLALAGDIAGIVLKNEWLQYICKPLIVLSLVGYFTSTVTNDKAKLAKWILLALLFSCAGDVLLMFQERNPDFFLFGLSAFLIAHIFYIIFFHRVRARENIKPNILFLLIVVAYYAGLIIWLSPFLGDMKLPVRVYGIVISFMLMLALHMLFSRNKKAARWMVMGALLFVLSDSILAINRFYQPFEAANILIMLSYGLAQLFLVYGAVRYIGSANSN